MKKLFNSHCTNKENVKHCWGGAHTSAYLGNIWKVVSLQKHIIIRKIPFKQQERGSAPTIIPTTDTSYKRSPFPPVGPVVVVVAGTVVVSPPHSSASPPVTPPPPHSVVWS